MALDSRQALGLLFRAGFSTAESVNKDAGRGVGMNLVADLVQQSGGKLGVATVPGKFTRFTIMLPELPRPRPCTRSRDAPRRHGFEWSAEDDDRG